MSDAGTKKERWGIETAPMSKADIERPPGAPKRRAFLLVYHREGVEALPLKPGAGVVVGREPPADVAIPDRSLSRRHAQFTLIAAEEVAVEDLGSTNGTRVGGQRIERATLRPGDEAQLGAVAVAVHIVSGADALPLGLESHESFRSALEIEITRSKFFHRTFAVLIVRAAQRGDDHLARWCPRVRALLRPVDRIALYSPQAVEILVPEADREGALTLARTLVAPRPGEPALLCGVAPFPGAAGSAEEILGVAWEAAGRAAPGSPVQTASADGAWTLGPRAAGAERERTLVVESPAMRSVVDTVRRLARSTIPVLLQGETGTGKEVLARVLHDSGPRGDKPLVSVNCGAIPATLVESTLFGQERGAFTGAVQTRGVFEAADGGTVLLDEIGELPAAAQAALLRVLETRRLTRIGSTKEIEVDVRIVTATHRDLEAMCAAGTFRSDLYFRLSVMIVDIPPLRARREDIAPLAARFLAQAAHANDRSMRGISADALALLERYAWPGNVRELRNAIERAVVIAEGDGITVNDLPARVRGPAVAPAEDSAARIASAPPHGDPAASLRERMDRFETEAILEALRDAGWNQTQAARRLELPLRTLQHKMKVYGIKRRGYGAGQQEPPRPRRTSSSRS